MGAADPAPGLQRAPFATRPQIPGWDACGEGSVYTAERTAQLAAGVVLVDGAALVVVPEPEGLVLVGELEVVVPEGVVG